MSRTLVSRRTLLKGIGAGAVGAALGGNARHSLAQNDLSATAFYRFNLGDMEITVIQDNVIAVDPSNYAVNASSEEAEMLLADHHYPNEVQRVPIDVMLVATAGKLALIDTGLGSGSDTPPRLLPTLELIGVQPQAITDVILSHFHPDHTGSISNANGLLFPNASVHFAQTEWDFIQSSDSNVLTGMINMALERLQPAIDDDWIQFYADGDELLPGIQAVATPGHTPGHHALLLSSGGQQLINLIDTAIHPLLSLQNPDWHFVSDILPEVAVETRRSTLQRAVDEQLFVFGYHFPFPGVGVVDTDGDGIRFLPVGF